MGLFTDTIKAMKSNKDAIYAKLVSTGYKGPSDERSVINESFARVRNGDPDYTDWVTAFLSDKIRGRIKSPSGIKKYNIKSSADGSDPLRNSIGFILSGGYSDAEYTSNVTGNSAGNSAVMILFVIAIGIGVYMFFFKSE